MEAIAIVDSNKTAPAGLLISGFKRGGASFWNRSETGARGGQVS